MTCRLAHPWAKEELVYALFPESGYRTGMTRSFQRSADLPHLSSPAKWRGALLWPPPVQTCDPGEMRGGFPLTVPVELQMVQPTFSISVSFKRYDL